MSPRLSSLPATYKVVLAYDGAPFHGVIPQPGLRTVGADFAAAVVTAAGQPVVALSYASRTDAGVHALGQVASFRLRQPLDVATLAAGVRAALPAEIRLRSLEEVPRSFHARGSSRGKHYRYRITRGDVPPAVQETSWTVSPALDVRRMRALAGLLVGTRDWTSLRHPRCAAGNRVKTVMRIDVRSRRTRWGQVFVVDVEGDGFLRQMVRRLVNTLALAGAGWFEVDDVATAIAEGRPGSTGCAAPARGLALRRVYY